MMLFLLHKHPLLRNFLSDMINNLLKLTHYMFYMLMNKPYKYYYYQRINHLDIIKDINCLLLHILNYHYMKYNSYLLVRYILYNLYDKLYKFHLIYSNLINIMVHIQYYLIMKILKHKLSNLLIMIQNIFYNMNDNFHIFMYYYLRINLMDIHLYIILLIKIY